MFYTAEHLKCVPLIAELDTASGLIHPQSKPDSKLTILLEPGVGCLVEKRAFRGNWMNLMQYLWSYQ